MISIICTKCKTTLSIDDAFAGGVCRCQHCGTIQTVPGRQPLPGQDAASKSLFQTKRGGTKQGSGLDELGEIIASSGLTSRRLRQPKPAAPTVQPKRKFALPFRITPALAGGLAAGVMILIVLLFFILRGNNSSSNGTSGEVTSRTDSLPMVPAGVSGAPNFAGIGLNGNSVVYVLDRGAASREAMGDIKEATFRSIASLGPGRKFRIVFWDTGKIEAFPYADPTYATAENLAAARKAVEDVFAFGASEAKGALESAVDNKPDEIVLVTAKGWDLDDNFVTMVNEVVGKAKVVVHTLSVGDPSAALATIAQKTGGQSLALKPGALRVAGK